MLFLIMAMAVQTVYGQIDPQTQLEKIIAVSPTAASIAKYGNIPVSYFTGSPSISITMFEAQSGKLKVPISLNYQFNGLKVEEIASWIGLGWTLNAGGVISRTVRGIPDEGAYGYMSIPGTNLYTTKFIIDSFGSPTYGDAIKYDLTLAGQGQYDLEPDIFYYNFPGGSGKFYYNQEAQRFYSLPAQNIKINYVDSFFVLITQDGNQYTFSRREFTNAYAPVCSGVSPATANTSRNITSWYLTKIKNNTDSITFEYTDAYYSFDNISSSSRYHLTNYAGEVSTESPSPPNFTDQVCTQSTVIEGQRLSYIRFRNGYIKFSLFSYNRCDLYGDKALNKVELFTSDGRLIKRFRMEYGYFGSTTNPTDCTSSDASLRLKLKKVWEEAPDSTQLPPYQMVYQEDHTFPSRLSYAQDHWGYYNGATGNSTLIPSLLWQDINGHVHYSEGDDRKPNFTYAQLGGIKLLKYPTGGHTEFEFENNEVKDSLVQPEFQWHEEHIEGDHNGGLQTVYIDTFVVNESSNYYNFFNSGGGAYADIYYDAIGCSFPSGASSCAVLTVEGLSSGTTSYGPMTANAQGQWLPNGTYRLKATFTQSPPAFEDFYFAIRWRQPILLTNSNLVGGLRIKKIKDYDGIDTLKNVIRSFSYVSDIDSLSSGKINGYPNNYVTDFHNEYYSSAEIDGDCVYYSLFRDFVKETSVSSFPLVATQGNYVGYEQVTVYEGGFGENGKTVYKFQNIGDILYGFPTASTSKEFLRGLLLSESKYKKSGSSFTRLTYDSTTYQSLGEYDSSLLRISYGLKTGFNTCWTATEVNCEIPTFWIQRFNVISIPTIQEYETVTGNMLTDTKTSVSYEGGNQIQTIQKFSYDGKNYLPNEIKTVNSKGDTLISRYKYNVDFTQVSNNPSWLHQLSQANISAATVEKLLLVKAPGGSEYITSGVISKFRNDRPLLDTISTLDITQPLLASSFTQGQVDGGGNFIRDSRYKARLNITKYDNYENTSSQKKANDFINSYIWDYRHTYPIAECLNADSAFIAYSSFESDGRGNWSGINASYIDSSTKGITGSRYYNQSSFSISKSGLNSDAYYIISYWSKNSSYTVSGTQSGYPKNLGSIALGTDTWTLYEHLVTGQTTVTITGSGALDELRLVPKDAQMTTYTYSPLIGMTSQCDANNKIAYYEYDKFNRLYLVRDPHYNILKKICYNYTGQVENCGIAPVCTSCSGTDKKCINGVCEAGVMVITSSVRSGENYICHYHYEWSDGSWSQDHTRESLDPCVPDAPVDPPLDEL